MIIRLPPNTLKDVENDFPQKPIEVSWCPGFYKIDGNIKLSQIKAYKDAKIIGLDVSSGFTVHQLEIQPNDHVLDLCCAPGSKLTMIHSLVVGEGTVTGVDLSKHRLSTCRSLIKKYKLNQARLFLEDGTRFSIGPPTILSLIINRKKDPENKKFVLTSNPELKKPFHASKLLRKDPQLLGKYDKVLVDAECTHDGSIVHLLKYSNQQQDWNQLKEKFSTERLKELETLQKGLLVNGFEQLKHAGILVYSTCSLSPKQNEEILIWFLKNYQNAKLLDIKQKPEIQKMMSQKVEIKISKDFLNQDEDYLALNEIVNDKTMRFYGQNLVDDQTQDHFWTSGFFLAKITKV